MKNNTLILLIVIMGLFFYALTLRGAVGNFSQPIEYESIGSTAQPLESSHEKAPFMQMLTILQDHQFNLTKDKADFAAPDVGYYAGKFYSFFPPGIAFILIPLYTLGSHFNLGLVFAYFTISIFAILSMVFLFKIARKIFKLPVWTSFFIVFIFAFGCTAWSYSITILQHATSTFFAIITFYLAWKYKQDDQFSWLWASMIWIIYGISIFVDYPNAVLLLPIMLYFLISSVDIIENIRGYKIKFRKTILVTFLFFVLISGVHLYYNQVNFGNWARFSNTFPRYYGTNITTLEGSDTVAITNQKQQISSIFSEKNLPFGIYELSVATDKGLFLFSPIFILALFGIYSIREKINPEITVITGFFVVNFILYASFGDPWGGYAYGPRYLIPCMPFLSLLVGIWVSEKRHILWRKLSAILLFIYSSAIALLGALSTNAIPPKPNALAHGQSYNFLYSLKIFEQGKSASFIYNTYLSHILSLKDYFLIIYTILILIVASVLFILPLFEHES